MFTFVQNFKPILPKITKAFLLNKSQHFLLSRFFRYVQQFLGQGLIQSLANSLEATQADKIRYVQSKYIKQYVCPSFLPCTSSKAKAYYVYTNKELCNPTSIKTRVKWCVSTTEALVFIHFETFAVSHFIFKIKYFPFLNLCKIQYHRMPQKLISGT